MVTDNNENLPKNSFGELDKLEKRENLDDKGENRYRNSKANPITALPYNAMLAFPFMNTGLPTTAAPIWWEIDDEGEDENKIP